MEIKRTTEILVETKRRFVVHQPDETPRFCAECGSPALAAERAAQVLQTDCRRVYRLVETSALHFAETESGAVLVCLESLGAALKSERGEREIGGEKI